MKAIIFIAPREISREAYFVPSKEEFMKMSIEAFMRGEYTARGTIEVDGDDPKAACEEAFKLTNNPMRQEERERKYGRHQSVSVGDIVSVDGVKYLCMSIGWRELGHCVGAKV